LKIGRRSQETLASWWPVNLQESMSMAAANS
jgi:hypothetical protein